MVDDNLQGCPFFACGQGGTNLLSKGLHQPGVPSCTNNGYHVQITSPLKAREKHQDLVQKARQVPPTLYFLKNCLCRFTSELLCDFEKLFTHFIKMTCN